MRRFLLVLVVSLLLGGVLGSGVTLAAPGEEPSLSNASGRALPPTPGEPATHRLEADVGAAFENRTLRTVTVDYDGSNSSLEQVETSDVAASVVRNPDSSERQEYDLPAAVYSVNDSMVTVLAAGNRQLRSGDRVVVRVGGVVNPPTTGPQNVTIGVDTGTVNAAALATLDIEYPPPSLSDQGRVGDVHRIAVHSPDGSGGFLVLRTADGAIVGTRTLPEDQNSHMDVGIASLLDDEVDADSLLRITAYRDVNHDGSYTKGVDRPWTQDGKSVEITVEYEGAPSTTEGASNATSTPGLPTTDSPGNATESTTPTTTPGFGIAAVAVALLLVGLVDRR